MNRDENGEVEYARFEMGVHRWVVCAVVLGLILIPALLGNTRAASGGILFYAIPAGMICGADFFCSSRANQVPLKWGGKSGYVTRVPAWAMKAGGWFMLGAFALMLNWPVKETLLRFRVPRGHPLLPRSGTESTAVQSRFVAVD